MKVSVSIDYEILLYTKSVIFVICRPIVFSLCSYNLVTIGVVCCVHWNCLKNFVEYFEREMGPRRGAWCFVSIRSVYIYVYKKRHTHIARRAVWFVVGA